MLMVVFILFILFRFLCFASLGWWKKKNPRLTGNRGF